MNGEIFPHEHFMNLALEQAQAARDLDEVPVGALIVRGTRVIGAAHNLCQQLRDPTAHAEMIAITQAAESIGEAMEEGSHYRVATGQDKSGQDGKVIHHPDRPLPVYRMDQGQQR